jgi:hypothetical protein
MRSEARTASLTPYWRTAEILPLFCVAFVAAYLLPSGVFPLLVRGNAGSRGAIVPSPETRTVPAAGAPDVRSFRKLEEAWREGASSGPSARRPDQWRYAKEDVPDVPKPLRSELQLAVGDLGGVKAAFLVYESWGDFTSVVDFLREDFHKDGWRRNHRFEELASQELPGALLSYSRGHERCLMSVEPVRETGRIETLVLYIEKGWLPPDTGF